MLDRLFKGVVRTTVNIATLPVAIAEDALFGVAKVSEGKRLATAEKLDQIKREAGGDD